MFRDGDARKTGIHGNAMPSEFVHLPQRHFGLGIISFREISLVSNFRNCCSTLNLFKNGQGSAEMYPPTGGSLYYDFMQLVDDMHHDWMSRPAGDHGITDAALAARFELYHGFPTIKPTNPTGLRQVLPPELTDITTKKLSDHRESDQLVGMLLVMLTAGAVPVFPPESAHNAVPRGSVAFYGDPDVERIVCKTTKHAMSLFRRRIQTSNGVVLWAASNRPTPFSS